MMSLILVIVWGRREKLMSSRWTVLCNLNRKETFPRNLLRAVNLPELFLWPRLNTNIGADALTDRFTHLPEHLQFESAVVYCETGLPGADTPR